MSESRMSNLTLLVLAGISMVAGMGMLLFELSTGVLYHSVPAYILWGVYLVLLLISVWGMKTWLEMQAGSFATFQRVLSRFTRGSADRAPQSHNLFRLPAEGQIYVLMLTIMLLGALFGKTNTLMLIFALMAGPFIVNGGITFGITRRLEMRRTMPPRIMQGDPISVDITVENRKRVIGSSLISVEDRIVGPRELLTGRLMFAHIPARTSRTGRYQVRFMQRGKYQLGPTRITSRFPLGIVERGRQLEVYDSIMVYPRIGVFAQWWLRRLSDGQESSRLAQAQMGAFQDEFHRIREYRQGDELRSIHWKTSARRNELMVKEYRPNRDRRLLLIVDLWRPRQFDSPAATQLHLQHVEHAVSLATTLGWGYLQECGPQQLDCLCFGQLKRQWLGSQRESLPEAFLDMMALIEPGSRFQRADLEQEIALRQSASTRCVLITTRSLADLQSAGDARAGESGGHWNGLMMIEADPAKTAEFFAVPASNS